MSREKKLVKNTVILSMGVFLPKIAALMVLPIYTAQLSKTEYGLYDLINIITYILTVVVSMQIHQAAFRFLIGEKVNNNKKEVISSTILLIVPLAMLTSSATFLFLGSIESIVVRIAICLFIFLEIILSVIGQITRGLGKNKVYAIGAIVRSFLNLAFVVVLLQLLNTGFLGLFLALDIALFIAIIYMIFSSGLEKYINFKSLNKNMILKMLAYSWPMIPNTISIWLINVMNRFIIIIALGIEMSAVYSVANKIPTLFTTAYGAFNMAWQESASIASIDKDSEKYYSSIFETLFGFLVGSMALLIAITPLLFEILIHGDYEEAYYQMPLLFMGMFFSSLSSYYGSIYIALKKTKAVGISSMIGALISFIINITFIKQIELYAASISIIVSFLVLTIYRGFDTRKFRKIQYNKKRIISGMILLILMCIMSYQKNEISNMLNGILAIFIAITYNFILIKAILSMFINKIKNK